MPVAWPSTLQDKVSSDSFNLTLGETRIKSDMDVGPAKYRRRYTKGVDIFSVSILLESISEYNDFYNFFDVDLNGGVEEFNYNHPITGTASVFKFSNTPSIRSLGAGVFSVSMEWELVPT